MELLSIIECLKGTGMQIKDIKQYIGWLIEGNSTLDKRLEMFRRQKQRLQEQMDQLKKHMEKINFKIEFYGDAVAHGDTDVFERNTHLVAEKERIFCKVCRKN